ncbi:MAG: response regulator [Nitrospinae bacterium]|nr:response regulator [Nitrospinota bacterium]
MNSKILFVDDDPKILSAFRRNLREHFQVETILGAKPALEIFSKNDPIAVVVADMTMPGMNGIQFLAKVKKKSPDTTRIMLTGYADQDTAINAVNEGNIFRFLCKPCPDKDLVNALQAGIEQYRLKTAEKELLDKTLNGSINALTEILSIYHPEIFGHSKKLKDLIHGLAEFFNIPISWEMEVAAMLATIGYVGIPPALNLKIQRGEGISPEEEEMLSLTPEIGAKFLGKIPRLECVSKIILYQSKRYNGSGFPQDSVSGQEIIFGARLIKILMDLIEIEGGGVPVDQAILELKSKNGWYDPDLLEKVITFLENKKNIESSKPRDIISVLVDEIQAGHILRSNVETIDGELLLSSGRKLSWVEVKLIRNHAKLTKLVEPLKVEINDS